MEVLPEVVDDARSVRIEESVQPCVEQGTGFIERCVAQACFEGEERRPKRHGSRRDRRRENVGARALQKGRNGS